MKDLLDKLQARILTLLGDETFDVETGGPAVPVVYQWELPPKRDQASPNASSDFPYILIKPFSGKAVGIMADCEINIRLGIWTSGTFKDGALEVDRLRKLLMPLQQPFDFAPYCQVDAYGLRWQQGDEEGDQPHPYHYVYLKQQFQFDSSFNNDF